MATYGTESKTKEKKEEWEHHISYYYFVGLVIACLYEAIQFTVEWIVDPLDPSRRFVVVLSIFIILSIIWWTIRCVAPRTKRNDTIVLWILVPTLFFVQIAFDLMVRIPPQGNSAGLLAGWSWFHFFWVLVIFGLIAAIVHDSHVKYYTPTEREYYYATRASV